jgi:hypothetical protein
MPYQKSLQLQQQISHLIGCTPDRRQLYAFYTLLQSISSKFKVNLWPTVSQPVCLVVTPPSGTHHQFFLEAFLDLMPGRKSSHICALVAALASEILSSWSYALCETMVPMLKTILKIVLQNTCQQRHFVLHVRNVSKSFVTFGKSQQLQESWSHE